MRKAPQGGQNDPQEGARDASGAAQETPGAPQERPQRRQERPKRRQEHPRRDPGALLGATFGARWRPEASGGSPGGFQEPFWEDLRGFWKGFRIIFDPSPRLPLDLLRFSSSLSVPTAKHKNAMKKRDTKHSKAKQSSRAEAHQDTRLKEELVKPSGLREHPPAHLYARTQLRQTADEHSQQLAPPPSNASSGDAACIFSVFRVALSVPVLTQV